MTLGCLLRNLSELPLMQVQKRFEVSKPKELYLEQITHYLLKRFWHPSKHDPYFQTLLCSE